ncbi:MAG: GNAT family N-acetyltransferase, partial [Treponema sp.]|nr:GNAT family N-acetyltransferase [Treponema sp.]
MNDASRGEARNVSGLLQDWRKPPEHPFRWRKMKRQEADEPERFLRRREPWCVGACGRFLARNFRKDQVWTLRNPAGLLSALILYSRRTVFPVFDGTANVPLLHFIRRHFKTAPIHAVQGLEEEVRAMEDALADRGLFAMDSIDYDLMTLDTEPPEENFRLGPPAMVLRRPDIMDMNDLFELQREYEKEEIIPRGSVFNPAACRLNLQRILAEEQILTAELDGRLVGKINTSAASFTRCQIGGVYVHPAYRGRG